MGSRTFAQDQCVESADYGGEKESKQRESAEAAAAPSAAAIKGHLLAPKCVNIRHCGQKTKISGIHNDERGSVSVAEFKETENERRRRKAKGSRKRIQRHFECSAGDQ